MSTDPAIALASLGESATGVAEQAAKKVQELHRRHRQQQHHQHHQRHAEATADATFTISTIALETSASTEPFEFCKVDIIGDNLFKEYWPFPCIEVWLQSIADKFSSVARVRSLGKSSEDRNVWVLEVNKDGFDSEVPKRRAVIIGGNHSREWLAIHTVLSWINTLLNALGEAWTQSDVIEWTFIPIINPDGYEFTWPLANPKDCDRLWRKTRSRHPGMGSCVGVNLNRNFQPGFCKGANARPLFSQACDELYCGPSAESEPEAVIMRDYVLDPLLGQTVMFLDVHTSGEQVIIEPCDDACRINDKKIVSLAKNMTKSMSKLHGEKYNVVERQGTKQTPTGVTIDFTICTAKVRHSMAFELRPGDRPATGNERRDSFYGFLIPPDNINPTAEETLEGLKQLVESAAATP